MGRGRVHAYPGQSEPIKGREEKKRHPFSFSIKEDSKVVGDGDGPEIRRQCALKDRVEVLHSGSPLGTHAGRIKSDLFF